MNELEKNAKKLQFLGILGQNGNFFKKALGTFFSHLQALTNCKVSEKSNERFSSNSVTDGRMDARTNERESLGLQRLHRETKKTQIIGTLFHPKVKILSLASPPLFAEC